MLSPKIKTWFETQGQELIDMNKTMGVNMNTPVWQDNWWNNLCELIEDEPFAHIPDADLKDIPPVIYGILTKNNLDVHLDLNHMTSDN